MAHQQNHISRLTDAHSRTHTCQEARPHGHIHISEWSGLPEHTALVPGLEDDWKATLKIEPSSEKEVFSLPGTICLLPRVFMK